MQLAKWICYEAGENRIGIQSIRENPQYEEGCYGSTCIQNVIVYVYYKTTKKDPFNQISRETLQKSGTAIEAKQSQL